jgi:hypothetical protein
MIRHNGAELPRIDRNPEIMRNGCIGSDLIRKSCDAFFRRRGMPVARSVKSRYVAEPQTEKPRGSNGNADKP